jgi:hypothetical protein
MGVEMYDEHGYPDESTVMGWNEHNDHADDAHDDVGDMPYFMDDPAVDRSAHQLDMSMDPEASAAAGRDLYTGTCSCGALSTPAWDDYAVQEAYDNHMADVQYAAHAVAEPCPSCKGTGYEWHQGRGNGDYYQTACSTCGNGRVGDKGTGRIEVNR